MTFYRFHLIIGALVTMLSTACTGSSVAPEVQERKLAPFDQSATDSPFEIVIKRKYTNPEQAELLAIAEQTLPSRKEVIEAMGKKEKEALDTGSTEALWWHDTFDGVYVPYAITQEALEYYVALTRSYRKGDFSVSNGITMETSSLEYTAEVTEHERIGYKGATFQNVVVVTMQLQWQQYCGNLCAMFFTKKRTVVFDQNGKLLRIFHDGATPLTVS